MEQQFEVSIYAQVLVDKNEQLSRELEECKTRPRATVAKLEESQRVSFGNIHLNCMEMYQLVSGLYDKSSRKFCRQSRGESGGRKR